MRPSRRVRCSSCPGTPSFNALVYVLAGSGPLGAEGRPGPRGQLVVFGRGDWFSVRADDGRTPGPNLEVLVLGGRPIREPVATTDRS